ncbi:hypothetical protein ACMYYO_00970 [Dermacoccaceae bacterium W4C1]
MSLESIGIIAAIVGVIGSFFLTWRGQQQDKKLSEAAADRAEAAARLTADNTERVLNALDRIAEKDFSANVGTVSLPSPRVRWSLNHESGDTYKLENIGDATAHDVGLSAHETLMMDWSTSGMDLAPGEATTFLALRSMGTSDSTISVTWIDDPTGSDRQQWRYPLPARPPRR